MGVQAEKYPGFVLEENLKKAITELLILTLFSEKDRYINELPAILSERSHNVLSIVFPYGAIYRLEEAGYIEESEKRIAPDGRKRQYFHITDTGRLRMWDLRRTYYRFTQAISDVLRPEANEQQSAG